MFGTQSKKILVVDDEQSIRDTLKLLLKDSFEVETLASGEELLEKVGQIAPDLIFLDIYLPGLDGLDTLRALQKNNTKIPVVMLSGSNTARTAVQAMKLGAIDYVNKPFNVAELTELILEHLSGEATFQYEAENPTKVEISPEKHVIIAKCEAMQEVLNKISLVAPHSATILITGESGTGKELVARQLHLQSNRAKNKFVALNCAALPENLIEAELFGYEKGAFTGANAKKAGLVEEADGGTLFLDEIGELSQALQVKLLRFLQEKEFYRLGGSQTKKVDVRIVTATNRNLEHRVMENKFRADLFYRLNVVNLRLPSLKRRGKEDLLLLINYFNKDFAIKYSCGELAFSEEALNILSEYEWPGNVRELENLMESLFALNPDGYITKDSLPARIKLEPATKNIKEEVEIIIDENFDFQTAGEEFERNMIEQALIKSEFIQTKAAKLLGISRRILKYKIDKLGITMEK